MAASEPHVMILPDGQVQIRVSPADAEIFTERNFARLLQLQDRIREQLFLAECDRECRQAMGGRLR